MSKGVQVDRLLRFVWGGMQMKVAEEFALKIQAFGKAMYFEGWQTQTVNWAKFPLLLVSLCVNSTVCPPPCAVHNWPPPPPPHAKLLQLYIKCQHCKKFGQNLELGTKPILVMVSNSPHFWRGWADYLVYQSMQPIIVLVFSRYWTPWTTPAFLPRPHSQHSTNTSSTSMYFVQDFLHARRSQQSHAMPRGVAASPSPQCVPS